MPEHCGVLWPDVQVHRSYTTSRSQCATHAVDYSHRLHETPSQLAKIFLQQSRSCRATAHAAAQAAGFDMK